MRVSIVKYTVDKLKRALAIVQDGDTATRNIAKDKFVNWKGNIYTANQAIASGSTLSAASGGNLTACDDGALNEIGNDITSLNGKITIKSGEISGTTDADGTLVTALDWMPNMISIRPKNNGTAQYVGGWTVTGQGKLRVRILSQAGAAYASQDVTLTYYYADFA